MDKQYLNNYIYEDLEKEIIRLGLKRFRAEQIFMDLHSKFIKNIYEIKQLPKADREFLNEKYSIRKISILETFNSNIDETIKLLYLLDDGNVIEGVLMKYIHGYTLCVSTQVGCRMGCSFCASTKNGLVRNLDVSEIVSQVYAVEDFFELKISNVVLMGSGEPFDNYDNVINALKVLNDIKGRNLSMRNITISTCGIVDKIIEFAESNISANLAISIHSFEDEERKDLMPISNKYDVDKLMEAIRVYQALTKNRVSFEYIVIPGVNDKDKDIGLIKDKLKGLNYIMNLIALNPINEYNKVNPRDSARYFKEKLEKNNVNVTLRRELGSDISASCGQLRIHYLKEGGNNEI